MLTLRQALDAIAAVATPNARFAHPKLKIDHGVIYAYNGQVAARAKFSGYPTIGPLVVDAEALSEVWTSAATMEQGEKSVTIRTKRTRYTLPVLEAEGFMCPNIVSADLTLSESARAAVHLAAKFASNNAIHPWACGVSLHKSRAIATNNIAAVSVECNTMHEGTLPFWAVETILKSGELPHLNIEESAVTVSYAESGVDFRSQTLSYPMPPRLFDLVFRLGEGDIPTEDFAGALEEVFVFGGRYCTLDLARGMISVDTEVGFNAETELSLRREAAPIVKLQGAVARLVLENATHIGMQGAPDRLVFSRNVHPRMVGIASGMRT